MPVSDKRIAANRRNAQKSTGPRTEAGKQRSRLNARRHGLTGFYLCDGEGEDAAALQRELMRERPDIAPDDAAEFARLSVLVGRARQARLPPDPAPFDSEPGAEPTQSRRAWLDAVVERAPLQRYVTALSRRRAQLIRRLLQASNAPAPAGAAPPPAPSHPHHRTPEEARPWPTKRRR
jgi:hypothetical protein